MLAGSILIIVIGDHYVLPDVHCNMLHIRVTLSVPVFFFKEMHSENSRHKSRILLLNSTSTDKIAGSTCGP